MRLGRYEIRSKLGAGGMADVYLAEDMQLGRRVALKLLPPETAADAQARKRLIREARAAATLDHPHICSVYEVGEAEGRLFIAMQYVEGRTLDTRLRGSAIELADVLSIAVQVVDALTEAHARGIIHRDIKPANIMLTTRGEAKVMDFGLAKPTRADGATRGETETGSVLSTPGAIVGTVPYMSPEQVRGDELDRRSDLFSVGVMLYEMVTGRRPFDGSSGAAIASAILTTEPLPLARFAPATPPELERIIGKALRKDPEERYQTAKDLLIDLRTLKDDRAFQARLERSGPSTDHPERATPAPATPSAGPRAPMRSRLAWVIAAALVVVAGGGWFLWRSANARWATAQLPQIVAFVDAKRYFDAFDLAVAVEPYLPGEPTIAELMPVITDRISVATDPPGAQVYLKRFAPDGSGALPARQLVGTTPLANLRIARGEYVLSIEKDGYAPVERTVSGLTIRVGTLSITPPPVRVEQKLIAAGTMPAHMVFVPGGNYRLVAWSRPTDRRVIIGDFFIDKYEATNQEFKEFINAGGYVKREFWKHPFVNNGRDVPWDEATKMFVDRTGLPGPRGWSNQSVPDGRADHPVTDVTWYEAAAYAQFRGKQLPTVYQWEKAARNGVVGAAGVTIMPWGVFYPGDMLAQRANFGEGTLPVTSSEFGMSTFGAFNMAGNVAEWTLNDSSEGYLATGGAWADPTYTFAQYGGRPAFYSSSKLGFRLVRPGADAGGDQGGARIEIKQEIPEYSPTPVSKFNALAATYRYEKTDLDARIEETTEFPEWKREKITFNGADGERAIAYLYLPNHVTRPLQVVHYVPAGDVDSGLRSISSSMDDRMAPFVKSGRAAFGVVLKGYIERLRPEGYVRPEGTTVEYVERIVNRVTDLRRGLDYLETRPDLDATRVALIAPSAGAMIGLILASVETRYRAVAMIGAGLPASWISIIAEANPINFAPHVRGPKLIVQGRYDEDTPLRTAAEPLFKLFAQPKRMVLYDGGHVPTNDVLMSATGGWLDEVLGRVRR
jgi:formylglycine-generating enzyme required for sulfatase activity/predicted Ser/Thr protein kinase